MGRAIVYLRVSTDEQAQSGLGLEAQERACRQFCIQNKLDVSNVYSDEGVSGTVSPEKRPGLMAAVSSMRRGDFLVVAKRDRLARDREAIVAIERAVKMSKGSIVSAGGEGTSLDENDPFTTLFAHMIDAFAQFERGMISHRTKAALQSKRARGQRISGQLPFGYRTAADGIHLEENPEEQRVLKKMRYYRSLGLAYRAIAKKLEAEGVRNREGNPWQHVSLHRILTRKPIGAESKSQRDEENAEYRQQLAGVGAE